MSKVICGRCGGSGSDGGQLHTNGVDATEFEAYRCEACDGFGQVEPTAAKPAEAEGSDFAEVLDQARVIQQLGDKNKQIDELRDALSAVTAERDMLREDRDSHQRVCIAEMETASQLRARILKLEQFVEFVKQMPVGTGVCCCGDSMERHPDPMCSGHTPVDEWDNALLQILKELGLDK